MYIYIRVCVFLPVGRPCCIAIYTYTRFRSMNESNSTRRISYIFTIDDSSFPPAEKIRILTRNSSPVIDRTPKTGKTQFFLQIINFICIFIIF